MLACQMAAIHNATMTAARRLNHVETIPTAHTSCAKSFLSQVWSRTFANRRAS